MRTSGQIVLTLLFIAMAAGENQPKPRLSKDPLTAEQVAIYRAVLVQYVENDSSAALNIADATEPFSWPDDQKECSKGLSMEAATRPPIVHRLSPAVVLGPKMVLVDPERQGRLVKQNDPQKLVHKAIDQHEPVSDKDLDESVQRAFSTGLFTFSEILFDKSHQHAILQYSFWCGSLCGNGKTLVIKKSEGKWRVEKECGDWVS